MDNLKFKYEEQKRSAKFRGIEFSLTFEEWSDIWDGKFHMRGVKSGQLGMLRLRDEGGYSTDNVRLGTPKENKQEAMVSKAVKKAGTPQKPNGFIAKPMPTHGTWLRRNPFEPYAEEDEEY